MTYRVGPGQEGLITCIEEAYQRAYDFGYDAKTGATNPSDAELQNKFQSECVLCCCLILRKSCRYVHPATDPCIVTDTISG